MEACRLANEVCINIWSRPYQVPACQDLLDFEGLGAAKLVLPVGRKDDKDSSGAGALQQLASDCAPATIIRGGKGVLDPTCYKAGTLAPAHFAITFYPADFGILDKFETRLVLSGN